MLGFADIVFVVDEGANLANLLSIASLIGDDSTLPPFALSTESDGG